MILNPPLKWAGGKRWLLPLLLPIWQANLHRRLVEPFCGGLAVALGLQPDQALLNDANLHVINFYRWLQRGLESDLSSAVHDKDTFYEKRERFNQLIALGQHQTQEAALLFYYLNRTCFNGLCRFNNKGFFNVPFGSHKTINYFRTQDFQPYAEHIANYQFRVGDFQDMALQSDDFIYADPPYDVEFTKYSQDDFRWDDQVRLVEWLGKHSGPVLLSNQATDRVIDLVADHGFEIHLLDAPRRISRTGDRTPAKEVLAYKNIELKIALG